MRSGVNDETLLAAFAKGDRAALGALADRYEVALLGMARGLVGGSTDLARDAVQETWVRVIRSARGSKGRSSVKTWLYRILINVCHDLRQAKWSRASAAKEVRDAVEPEAGAGDSVEPDEFRAMLRSALDALPGERRVVLLLCYHAGLTHTEAAGALEIPLGTLKSRLHAALGELRERLSSEAMR